MLYPKRLQTGDTIGVIAPAGPPNIKNLHKAIPFLEKLGLNVKLGQHIKEVYGYLAGSDEQRLSDFHAMIKDPQINGIVFARGGYGTGRFVDNIDYELIKENPKIIWGYSDITYLHTAIRQETGLITFHGPMLATDIANEAFDERSGRMFEQLFSPLTLTYDDSFSETELTTLVDGKATAPIVGGNLSLIVSTLGTPYELDTRDKLVLIEDIGEMPYRIDSMLNQLKLAGKIDDASGFIIGDFAESDPGDRVSLSLDEVVHHYFGHLTIPVMSGFKIGHCYPHFAIPLGVEATLDTNTKRLIIKPGVH